MRHSSANAANIIREAENVLANNEDHAIKLHRLWLTLSFIQASALANELQQKIGNIVYSGPFKGMKLTSAAMQGAYAPVLYGCYESELHGEIEKIIASPYAQILNIGCSFGYYTVGLARRMPQTTIYSYDIDAKARKNCLEMAALNEVAAHIHIGEEFRGEDFQKFADAETLVLMDIEGAERFLLDPQKFPALQKMDVLVELHDLFDAGISQTIVERFSPTHNISYYMNRAAAADLSPIVGAVAYVDPLDHMLLSWENRDGPTPWAVMRYRR